MARILLLVFSFIVVLAAQAQGVVRQQGYVRSVGRPENKAGKRLPGAVIKVAGQHNTVRSGQNGLFTLEFNGLREGKDSYSFASVRLAGYDLPENGMLGRRYPLSSTVPVEVVLVPQALKIEIEEKVRHTVETQYRKKLQHIEALRAKDMERYRTELQRLEAEYEKREKLITDLVERYASTDYAHLDSLSARINQYIEAGELERADSLINAQDISRLESEHAALQARTDQLRTDLAQSESASAASLRQLMSLYEGKRDIHIARFENDSAALYWEKIVQMDTTNVGNALEAGKFVSEFIADYDKAMELDSMALRNALRLNGENNADVASSYNNIGIVYFSKGQYIQALEFTTKALSIQILDENNLDVATSYNNLGTIYSNQGLYTEALENYARALAIYKKEKGENHPDVAIIFSNIGAVYARQRQYALSLDNYTKSLSIISKVHNKSNPNLAICYNNIGELFAQQGQHTLALENYKEALSIALKIYGEDHPNVAVIYNNIGSEYTNQGMFTLALEYYSKALSINLKVYGEEHPGVAIYYAGVGMVYALQRQYTLAIENYEKALAIRLKVYGNAHPYIALHYAEIGMIRSLQHNYVSALENYKKCLSVNGLLNDTENSLVLLSIYVCYDKLRIKNPEIWQSKYEEYVESHMATITITPKMSIAPKNMDGTYYVLEFGDWQTGSTANLMDEKDRLAGKPKTVVFYRDGKFIKENFEDQIGVQLGVKSVDKSERKAIIEAWKKWRGE